MNEMAAGSTVKDIVRRHLESIGADGLASPLSGMGCGCDVSDLMPCGSPDHRCEPAMRVDYPDGDCPCGDGCDWHMVVSMESEEAEMLRSKLERITNAANRYIHGPKDEMDDDPFLELVDAACAMADEKES